MFGKYLKAVKPPSGSGSDAVEINEEWEHLRWLPTHINHRTTRTNIIPPKEPTKNPGEQAEINAELAEEGRNVFLLISASRLSKQ